MLKEEELIQKGRAWLLYPAWQHACTSTAQVLGGVDGLYVRTHTRTRTYTYTYTSDLEVGLHVRYAKWVW